MGACHDCVQNRDFEQLYTITRLNTEEEIAAHKNVPNAQADIPVTRTIRNRPPFPGLPSYGITSIVLGYTGYADEIKELLE